VSSSPSQLLRVFWRSWRNENENDRRILNAKVVSEVRDWIL
jgi:hypothetical protein